MREDELHCCKYLRYNLKILFHVIFPVTLTDGNFVSHDINGKPILHQKGLVTQNIESSWQILCDDAKFSENRKEMADNICHIIGFQ